MMSILCSATDAVGLGNWFTLFKVLTLNVAIQYIHLSTSFSSYIYICYVFMNKANM